MLEVSRGEIMGILQRKVPERSGGDVKERTSP